MPSVTLCSYALCVIGKKSKIINYAENYTAASRVLN
jgi:hypothetical protein